MVQHIYIGPWVWQADPESGEWWDAPVRGIPHGSFDLRSVAACASTGLSTGFGIFVYPQLLVSPPASLVYLGERGAAVLAPRKAAIRTDLVLGENIVASTVGEMVAELFLQHAEPQWILRWGRLRGNLTCLGEVWHRYRMRPGQPEYSYLLECLRTNYQKLKAETALGLYPPNFHRRYLQYQLEHYRVLNYEDITQDSRESPLPHGTTWSETWPTTGTDISTGQDQVWTETVNDADVDLLSGANRLNNVSVSTHVFCRCETALAGDAHFCQGTERSTTTTTGFRPGICTRFAAAANTFYSYRFTIDAGTESELFKTVAGTVTSLATFDDDTPANNTDYVLKLTSKDNDTHTCTRDGVDKITDHSNADITGNVRCGVTLRANGAARAHWHALSAEDLAAAGDPEGSLLGGKLLRGGLLRHGVLVRS